VAGYLGGKVVLDIMESLKEPALSGDDTLRAAALAIMDRRITAGLVGNRDGAVEFLFRILRAEHEPSRRAAAVMLWKLGDDYAPEVLRDFLGAGTEESAIEVLQGLRGSLAEPLLPALAPLFAKPSATLHGALRDVLLQVEDAGLRDKLVALAVQMRGGVADDDDGPAATEESVGVASLGTERASFQFEREHIQELVVFFSDIVGYSKKAQVLSPMQLSTLIQDYEKILLSHTESHRGELVKRMGDGHMIVFERALDATLAAIRLQKALRRFNRYRDETTRVVIRIGIHAGPVVRKDKDILGNNVNIASRLESSAQPGSILISDQVHEKVKDAVHAREIGHITVKNISEPIKVFEPYEIVLDLPPEKDPLRQAGRPAPAARPPSAEPARGAQAPRAADSASAATMPIDKRVLVEIVQAFGALDVLCRGAKDGNIAASAVSEQVLARWARVKSRLPAAACEKPTPRVSSNGAGT
jgi:class 3 adenylate cyclase